jgi:HEPN superfamily Swt1-like protein
MAKSEAYSFVFRGLLTEEALDKAGRLNRQGARDHDTARIEQSLGLKYVDDEFLIPAARMAVVYTAITAFENSVRSLVKKVLLEAQGATWWDSSVPEGIRKKAESRHEEEQKIKWHSKRGDDLMSFIDFSQLNSIIVNMWPHFENLLTRQQWVQNIFDTMERSRTVIMHSGDLPAEDIERIGVCITRLDEADRKLVLLVNDTK